MKAGNFGKNFLLALITNVLIFGMAVALADDETAIEFKGRGLHTAEITYESELNLISVRNDALVIFINFFQALGLNPEYPITVSSNDSTTLSFSVRIDPRTISIDLDDAPGYKCEYGGDNKRRILTVFKFENGPTLGSLEIMNNEDTLVVRIYDSEMRKKFVDNGCPLFVIPPWWLE